jgi:hypothetical protein
MPLFYFALKRDAEKVADRNGLELPDENAAREHAIEIARDLMRNQEVSTRSWRIEVCDDYLIPRFDILFAEIDGSIDHLTPECRKIVEVVSRKSALLQDALGAVQNSMSSVKETLARVDAVVNGVFKTPQSRAPGKAS